MLNEKIDELEAVNRALRQREREITRRNAELDRRRREAEEASERKTRLLRSVSHDIRSPVTAITLMAEVIRRSSEDPDLATRIPGLALRLQASARSLADLLSDVLDIASFGSGRVSVNESEFSLNALLADECARLLPLAEAKALRLVAELPEPAIRLRADRVKLVRIVNNLLGNAIKFTEIGGVTVTAELTTDHAVLIRVRDTGVGLAPEDLAVAFDEFAQMSHPGRDGGKGWGLGLPICRRLVEVMDGRIAAESRLDHGSVFTVWLPQSRVVDRSNSATRASSAFSDR